MTNSTTQPTVIQSTEATVADNVTRKIDKTADPTAENKFESEKVNSRNERRILDSLMSRKKLYKILMDKMEKYMASGDNCRTPLSYNFLFCVFRAGFNGEECLFKAICEAAEHPFGDYNGVLGDIVHIIFR